MSDNSQIEWTDATWNPVTGCSKVSPGCAHCYAEGVALRFWSSQYPLVSEVVVMKDAAGYPAKETLTRPRAFTDVQCHEDRLDQPLRRKKPTTYFVNSMSDLFHEDVPDQFIVDVFGIMALAHWHTFQILTKRPERMRRFFEAGDHGILRQFMLLQQNGGTSTRQVFRALDIKRRDNIEWRWPLSNVWLGVSVENQHFADERIPLLLKTPAAVRFISAEPLLDSVNLNRYGWLAGCDACCTGDRCPGRPECTRFDRRSCPVCKGTANGINLDWVIVGGESGPKSRPFHVAWARSIVAQCKAAGVPCFVKQLGANVIVTKAGAPWIHSEVKQTLEGQIFLRDKKGGDPAEWPEDLRVRQFPSVSA